MVECETRVFSRTQPSTPLTGGRGRLHGQETVGIANEDVRDDWSNKMYCVHICNTI